jgi:hypothetical protein
MMDMGECIGPAVVNAAHALNRPRRAIDRRALDPRAIGQRATA